MQNADAENTSVEHTSALVTRSCMIGTQITARPTSQITYQGKNQGVTMSRAPNTPRLALASVRVVGTRHTQKPPTLVVTITVSRLMTFHVLCKLSTYSGFAIQLWSGKP